MILNGILLRRLIYITSPDIELPTDKKTGPTSPDIELTPDKETISNSPGFNMELTTPKDEVPPSPAKSNKVRHLLLLKPLQQSKARIVF